MYFLERNIIKTNFLIHLHACLLCLKLLPLSCWFNNLFITQHWILQVYHFIPTIKTATTTISQSQKKSQFILTTTHSKTRTPAHTHLLITWFEGKLTNKGSIHILRNVYPKRTLKYYVIYFIYRNIYHIILWSANTWDWRAKSILLLYIWFLYSWPHFIIWNFNVLTAFSALWDH